jgi:zinc/manganese transport system substrate-binding protein
MTMLLLAACAPAGGGAAGGSSPGATAAGTAAPPTAAATSQTKLPVVASFSILGDLVQQVGGDKVEVRTLVGAGADAHTFEPSPADSAALTRAVLVFENGLGFEPWLERLYAASGSKARRVVVTDGLTALHAEEDEGDGHGQAAKEKDKDDHGHGEQNPHAWHDVRHAQHMVGVIREALAAADPANAAVYRANGDRYLTELQALDTWIGEQVNSLPPERRKLVTTHDTFRYFAVRYGFEVVGTALGAASTEAAEPSAGEFARLVQAIKDAGVPAIFAENVANPRLMERLAHEAGVTLAPTLYTDALGQPGSNGETYVKMMRYNVTTIVDALKK